MTLIIVNFIVVAVTVAVPLAFALAITARIFKIYATLNVALAIAVYAISFDNPLAHYAVVG